MTVSVVVEYRLTDLYGLEGEPYGACGSPGLPNLAVELGRRLFTRVVGTEKSGRGASGGSLVDSRNNTIEICKHLIAPGVIRSNVQLTSWSYLPGNRIV